MTTATEPLPTPTAASEISADDFAYLAQLVERRSAILLERGKEYLVQTRLAPLLRSGGHGSFERLVRDLRQHPGGSLEDEVVDAMTTNETSFFRDAHPFEAIAEQVIPQLLQLRSGRSVTIWCGACSSGQEPYSLAMMLSERFPELVRQGRAKIVATDLSPAMVARTRAGRYSTFEVNRGLPSKYLLKYFTQNGPDWVIGTELAGLVTARQLNLLDSWSALPRCDIVMLRNVLIYFAQPVKQEILRRVREEIMGPDAVLLLGSSETTYNIDPGYVRREAGKTSYYQRADTGP